MPPLKTLWRLALTQTWWRTRLAAVGPRAVLYRPLMVVGARCISIGARSSVRDHARLEAIQRTGVAWQPRLTIGARVNIEQGVHIVCQCEVTIGDDVSITPYCVIVDTDHPGLDPDRPPKIGARLPEQPSHVRIGAGSFIGAHSVILPNVTIGKGCVIGAGSVVTRNVPDYAVVSGVPARIVKVFDPATRSWSRPVNNSVGHQA
jgi:acetyltransferase-like isoleucine patch superfamily enzyme